MRIKRDRYGVPILDAQAIEHVAEGFLSIFASQVLDNPIFTPIAAILDQLQRDDVLVVDLASDLGRSPEGQKYLGCFNQRTCSVRIDRSLLDDDPRFSFTVAHELGHFVLHRDVDLVGLDQKGSEIRDTARHLTMNRLDSSNPRSFLEWHANRFAAGILLPRRTVASAVAGVQRDLGISRNLGMIWVSTSQSRDRDYIRTIVALSELYQTSKAVVRYRLEELGLVKLPRRKSDFVSLGELLSSSWKRSVR